MEGGGWVFGGVCEGGVWFGGVLGENIDNGMLIQVICHCVALFFLPFFLFLHFLLIFFLIQKRESAPSTIFLHNIIIIMLYGHFY